jgi:hypothetical protein
MNADARRWIRMMALTAIFSVAATAPHVKGEELQFLLTPLIERLGENAPASDSAAATDDQPNQDAPLQCDGLHLTGDLHIESRKDRITAPANGPAPIRLEFQFQPVWNEGSERLFDYPTQPTPPPSRRDDSYLLAERDFTFGGLKFSR